MKQPAPVTSLICTAALVLAGVYFGGYFAARLTGILRVHVIGNAEGQSERRALSFIGRNREIIKTSLASACCCVGLALVALYVGVYGVFRSQDVLIYDIILPAVENGTFHTNPKRKRGNELTPSLALRVGVISSRGQYKCWTEPDGTSYSNYGVRNSPYGDDTVAWKRKLGPPAAIVFWPLCEIEDAVRWHWKYGILGDNLPERGERENEL